MNLNLPVKIIAGIIIGVIVLVVVLLSARKIAQMIVKNKSNITSENGIDEMISMEINGVEQWLYLRGEDRNNPILLWVEGGPGEPLISYCRDIGRKTGIEKDFTVVYWDQRGTGKSSGSQITKEDLTLELYVQDVHSICDYLKDRFTCDKVYLLGRSWGSIVSINAANQYPDDFYAYIGVGQVTNGDKIRQARAEYAYECLKADNRTEEAQKALEIVQAFQQDEFVEQKDILSIQNYVDEYRGFSYSGRDSIRTYSIKHVLTSPEYTIADVIKVARFSGFPGECLQSTVTDFDVLSQIDTLQIPCYFFEGRHDYQVSSEIAAVDIEQLKTVSTKEIIWFEESAHVINDDEPEKFHEMLRYCLDNTLHKE